MSSLPTSTLPHSCQSRAGFDKCRWFLFLCRRLLLPTLVKAPDIPGQTMGNPDPRKQEEDCCWREGGERKRRVVEEEDYLVCPVAEEGGEGSSLPFLSACQPSSLPCHFGRRLDCVPPTTDDRPTPPLLDRESSLPIRSTLLPVRVKECNSTRISSQIGAARGRRVGGGDTKHFQRLCQREGLKGKGEGEEVGKQSCGRPRSVQTSVSPSTLSSTATFVEDRYQPHSE